MIQLFNNLRMAFKLALAFGVCIAALVATGLVGLRGVDQLKAANENLSTDILAGTSSLGVFAARSAAARIYQYRGVGSEGDVEEECFANADKRIAQADEALVDYKKCLSDEKEKELFQDPSERLG